MARRGVTTVVETDRPEHARRAHHQGDGAPGDDQPLAAREASPYRISEISISASIPPAVSFAIGRLDDDELVGDGAFLGRARRQADDAGELVLALDGTTVDDAAVTVAGCRATATRCRPAGCPRAARRRAPIRPRTPREHRLDVLDRAGRPLARRPLGDLDAAGRQRARRDGQDPGHAEQLGIGELDARRLVAVVPQDLVPGPASSASACRRSAISSTLRLLGRADRDEVGGVRRDLGRPDDALVVVVRLDDAGHVPPDADPVRAHDDRVRLAVLAEVGRAGGVGELRPELEDVADLDPVAQDDRLAADRAGVALLGVRDVGDDVGRVVAPDVDVAVVEALAVGAGDEVRLSVRRGRRRRRPCRARRSASRSRAPSRRP